MTMMVRFGLFDKCGLEDTILKPQMLLICFSHALTFNRVYFRSGQNWDMLEQDLVL